MGPALPPVFGSKIVQFLLQVPIKWPVMNSVLSLVENLFLQKNPLQDFLFCKGFFCKNKFSTNESTQQLQEIVHQIFEYIRFWATHFFSRVISCESPWKTRKLVAISSDGVGLWPEVHQEWGVKGNFEARLHRLLPRDHSSITSSCFWLF